jgi:hypothetical protein
MRFLCLFISFFAILPLIGQEESTSEYEQPYSPTIGFGVGTIGFYGDLNDKNYGSPFSANPGFNVYIIQPIEDYLSVKFNLMIGNVREEERSLERNLNFESELRAGSILLEYNFDHFLPKDRKITPFVTSGIEVVEFNPKSDLKAFGGQTYHYWSDGTIRSIDESSANSDQAIILQRDYDYETDIREVGFNNSTTYDERTLSIPVGVGITMHLNDQFDFRFESVMHLTFSDYLDGVTRRTREEYTGSKRANANNDHFYYNGFSLSYNFQKVEGAPPFDDFREIDKTPIDFLATGNTEDFDNDGVIDLVDNCPNTPARVEVDSLGCPVDTDNDGVPDYLDKEINTAYPQFANQEGVELTDEMIYRSYMRYIDSTLQFAETIERDFTGNQRSNAKKYRVKVGEYNKGETPEDMSKLLSLSDLNKVNQGDKTIYTAGSFRTLPEANNRAAQLKQQGFTDLDVLKRNANGEFISVGASIANTSTPPSGEASPNSPTSSEKMVDDNRVVFRVQLGAFKHQPSGGKFDRIPSLFIVEAGGYYRYMSGSFDNFGDAAKHKVRMIVEGFEGAFVVAYKSGKRVSLKSVGVDPISSDPLIGK